MTAPLAAVLLAGGKSRRMGQDKALLPLPDGRRLWERQRDVLLTLAPVEWFVSGEWRAGFPPGLPWIADARPDAGPLAGITAALRQTAAPRLVVLAVDMPAMTAEYLRRLVADSAVGVIPQWPDGRFEPLAAVYPQAAAELAADHLLHDIFSLQTFARALTSAKLVEPYLITNEQAGLFTNWNRPGDLPA